MKSLLIEGVSLDTLQTLIRKTIEEEFAKENLSLKGNSSIQTERYLSRKETAKLFGVSLPTLHKWTLEQKVKGYRIGNVIRYKESEIDNALESTSISKYSR